MKLQHFLLTRFNLRERGHIAMSNGRWKGLDESYLERRFSLFEKYCLPSVKAQGVSYTWLVFYSDRTPEKFKERAKKYREVCANYIPIFIDEEAARDLYVRISEEILKCVDSDADVFICGRIDNDDSLGVSMMSALQKKVVGMGDVLKSKTYVLTCPNGYAYNEGHRLLQYYSWKWNHFPSLVGPVSVLKKHIFYYPHDLIWKEGFEAIFVNDYGCWLEVVHGGNLTNNLRLHNRPTYRNHDWFQRHFAIDVDNGSKWSYYKCLFLFWFPVKIKTTLRFRLGSARKFFQGIVLR